MMPAVLAIHLVAWNVLSSSERTSSSTARPTSVTLVPYWGRTPREHWLFITALPRCDVRHFS